MTRDVDYRLNLLGTFRDHTIEKSFFSGDMHKRRRLSSIALISLGVLFFLFIIPDSIYAKPSSLLLNVCLRLSMLVITFALSSYVLRTFNYQRYAFLLTAAELLLIAIYLSILPQYPQRVLAYKTFDILIILMGFYLLPNKITYRLLSGFVCVSLSLLYIRFSGTFQLDGQFVAHFIYITLTFLVFTIVLVITERSRRAHYEYTQTILRLTQIDSLTGVYNRNMLDKQLTLFFMNYIEKAQSFCIIVLDVDNFKRINDCYGHRTGDDVLINLTDLLRKKLGDEHLLARWGGDEFVILLSCNLEVANKLAEELRNFVAEHLSYRDIKATCSFGVAEIAEGEDAEGLFTRADRLLYKAKERGRNIVVS